MGVALRVALRGEGSQTRFSAEKLNRANRFQGLVFVVVSRIKIWGFRK